MRTNANDRASVRSLFFFAILFMLGLYTAHSAFACGQCQYQKCVSSSFPKFKQCTCLPEIGSHCGVPGNPLPDLLNTIDGAVHGNAAQIVRGIGGAILDSNPANELVANSVLGSDQKKFAEEVVGRGFLVLVSTGDPVLVAVDAAGNIISQIALNKEPPPLPIPAPTPAASQHSYSISTATCMVKFSNGTVVAGWKNEPTVTDVADHTSPG